MQLREAFEPLYAGRDALSGLYGIDNLFSLFGESGSIHILQILTLLEKSSLTAQFADSIENTTKEVQVVNSLARRMLHVPCLLGAEVLVGQCS